MRKISFVKLSLLVLCFVFSSGLAQAQTNEFTYQGRLVDGSLAANGTYEMQFRLFDAETDGTQQPQGAPITLDFTVANGNPVVVSNGIFTVKLNFTAAAFPGAARFLEINVRRTAGDTFNTLNPRQPITSAPHNIRSLSSGSSDGLSVACVLCVTDAQIQSLDGSKVTGTVASATTANNVSGIVPIANGGTGSSTHNFVDLSTNQTNIAGNKTFTGILSGNGAGLSNVPGTFKWQAISGLSQQAEPNKGYLVTNDTQVNISLPQNGNMSVGDIVRVSGAGAGSWKIFANASQQSFVGSGFAPAATWDVRAENQNWQSIAASADGEWLIAAVKGGQLYTSTDSGLSWWPRESNRNWQAVASSADGNKLVAVVEGGQIYTSTNTGFDWTPRETNRNWNGVASSADGSKLVAVVNSGQIYTSTDSGVTWFSRETNRLWNSVASSADGNKLVATVRRNDFIAGGVWISTNSGINWTNTAGSYESWAYAASSADGGKLIVSSTSYGGDFIIGRLITSTDSGITWTGRETSRNWHGVCSSADGSKLIAVVFGGQIYISNNSGVSWAPRETNRNWMSVACSADGNKAVAVVYGGQIYRTTDVFAPIVMTRLTGGQYASVELQYIGEGKFMLLSQQGAITGTQF